MDSFEKINKHLDGWKVARLIGRGSFGAVYEIEKEEVDVKTFKSALKVITIPQDSSEADSMLSSGTDEATVKDYYDGVVKDIVGEYVLMSDLKGTSNVVSYEDHKKIPHDDGIGCDIFIRMELLTSLFDYIRDNDMSEKTAVQIGIDICSALDLCHRHNILHRDIKPGNIFWSENGNFKLGDFGIARTVEKASGELSRKGTYQYMAPEVYCGGQYDERADIYSLGIVLYYIMNGNRIPFLPPAPAQITHDDMESAIRRRLSKSDGKPEELPPILNASYGFNMIIKKACAANPEERFSDAGEMKTALEALQNNASSLINEDAGTTYLDESKTTILSDETEANEGQSEIQNNDSNKKKKISIIISIIIAAVVVSAGLFFVFGHNQKQGSVELDICDVMESPVFEGANGEGYIAEEASVSDDANRKILNIISDDTKNSEVESFIHTIKYSSNPSKSLSNGDSITVTATYDESKAAALSLTVTGTPCEVKVRGLYEQDYYDSPSEEVSNGYEDYSDCVFPDSGERYLERVEVERLSDDELQEAINEIYARNGKIFSTAKIKAYYNSKDWYEGYRKEVNMDDLNEYERENLDLLIEERSNRRAL